MPKVLYHACVCKCKGILIIPEWPSAVFWLLISPDGQRCADFVVAYDYLPLIPNLFILKLKEGEVPYSNVLALRIDLLIHAIIVQYVRL